MNKDSFETISADDLALVGGGIDVNSIIQGVGSFFGQKGQAVAQGIGGIWQNIQGIIGAFKGGGQPQAGGPQQQGGGQ
jgi:hypothetical protein